MRQDAYPAKTQQGAAMMLMIQNNLDPRVAQFPHELVTYGGNGSVFSNWAQFWLVMEYLSSMSDEQTLVMMSGHPLGLFPSHADAPRCVITNGACMCAAQEKRGNFFFFLSTLWLTVCFFSLSLFVCAAVYNM